MQGDLAVEAPAFVTEIVRKAEGVVGRERLNHSYTVRHDSNGRAPRTVEIVLFVTVK